MAITKEQAMTLNEVFTVTCIPGEFSREDRKRGYKVYRWRRNGETKTWVRDAGRWRFPVKYGIRVYHAFTEQDAGELYATEAEAVAYGEEVAAEIERRRAV